MSEEEQTTKVGPSLALITWVLGLLCAVLLWWIFVKSKSINLEISSNQFLLGAGIIAVAIYIVFRVGKAKVLPPAHEIVEEIALWYKQNYYPRGVDVQEYEATPVTDTDAYVYFPQLNETIQYNANTGVMGRFFGDLEEALRRQEEHAIVKEFLKNRGTKEHLTKELQERGYVVE